MTPEAQRISIMNACGWTERKTVPYPWTLHNPPDFLNDLNAMHEAEKILMKSPDTWANYIRELTEVTRQKCVHAEAYDRAESFLRALNIWTES